MDNNNIQVFSHEQFGKITAVQTEDGKILFKANNVAKALGYSQPAVAISKLCKGVSILEMPTENQHGTVVMQQTRFLSEADIYRLVMRSKLPEAERFQDWVCEEVLPTIRQHGAYMTAQTLERALTDPKFLIQLATKLDEERTKRIEAERQIEVKDKMIDEQSATIEVQTVTIKTQQVKLERYSAYVEIILSSKNLVTVSEIAQDYEMSAIALNKILSRLGIQRKVNNQWILYAKYLDGGYVQSRTFTKDDGFVRSHTCWTQKGRLFLYDILKKEGILPVVER